MRIKVNTLAYIIIGIIFSLIPTVIVWLSVGNKIYYVVEPFDVLLIFTFTFVPLVIGFLAGEMYVDDMNESDPLYNPIIRKK
jgi:hypothetical protein